MAQVLSLGMERIKERVLPLLVRILREDGQVIRGVYERNDAALRTLEGMAQGKGWLVLPGEAAPEGTHHEDIAENGIRYTVDFENGQKTGFFLDQKYNRLAVAKLAKGKTVLDCFTHTGSFALNAAKGGAAHVTAVDVSESAVEMARANAAEKRSGRRDGAWRPMSLTCCRPWKRSPSATTSSSWIRRPSPSPGRPWRTPSPGTRRSTTGPCAAAPGRISGHLLLLPLRPQREKFVAMLHAARQRADGEQTSTLVRH